MQEDQNWNKVRRKRRDMGESIHKCGFCSEVFRSNRHLEVHVASHTKERYFQCEQCNKQYATAFTLSRHVNSAHTRLETFICKFDECREIFARKDNYKNHLRVKHYLNPAERPFKCHLCAASFKSVSLLNRHLNDVHTKKKTYACDYQNCGKVFVREEVLRIHLARRHETNPLVPCPICNSKFKQVNLRRHVREFHMKSRNQTCDVCDRTFCNPNSLARHKNTHLPSLERPVFQCNLCEKKFPRLDNLKLHLKIVHIGKRIPCTFCKREFSEFTGLQIHLRTHTKEKPYFCQICKSEHSCSQGLKTHITVQHGSVQDTKPLCTVCNKNFTESDLQAHITSHTKERLCVQCSKTFIGRRELKKHTRPRQSVVSVSVSVCKNDTPGQTAAGSLKCQHCFKTLASAKSLSRHSERYHYYQTLFNCEPCVVLIEKLKV